MMHKSSLQYRDSFLRTGIYHYSFCCFKSKANYHSLTALLENPRDCVTVTAYNQLHYILVIEEYNQH
jgi:hypothetical protein